MANSVYEINKGINKSIEFRGLKAQYIWYLGGCVVLMLVLFGILYALGIPQYICVAISLAAGAGLAIKVYALSGKYGEYGLMKVMAKRSIPKLVKSNSRRPFIQLKK